MEMRLLQKTGSKLVWASNGSDIYYQGDTEKELPVECKIRYELERKRSFR